jgi:hypothetical protein
VGASAHTNTETMVKQGFESENLGYRCPTAMDIVVVRRK